MVKERLDPNPSSFVHSLRSVGYSLETAVADVIDNSIAATASKIDILFKSDGGNSVFAIIDNGKGMTADQLREAMRLGSTSPLHERKACDLGRFGLGMKTASFSICKRLTVVSSVEGHASAARWDLDEVEKSNSWNIDLLCPSEISNLIFSESFPLNGTVVIWEKIDRLIDASAKSSQKELEAAIAKLEKHLRLTFHRYIEGEQGIKKTSIHINGHKIESFDPFNRANKATQELEEDVISIGGSRISITPYILPHHSKTEGDEYERYAGDGGYLANQGFYVYRNKRLIVHGTWFRLVAPENLTKLARVRIDIPNDADISWNIDVKKSTATPPAIIRERLKGTIDRITGRSATAYKARGRKLAISVGIPMWVKVVAQEKIRYQINLEHPLIKKMRGYLVDKEEAEFASLLDIIAKCFPTDLLFSDYAASPNSVVQNDIDVDALIDGAEIIICGWVESGIMTRAEALDRLSDVAPFNQYMDHIRLRSERK